MRFGALLLSLGLRTAQLNEEAFPLTPSEFDFLAYLMIHQERAVSRDELLRELWKFENFTDTRASDDLVKRLRRKFRERSSPIRIETVWGYGFRLTEEES